MVSVFILTEPVKAGIIHLLISPVILERGFQAGSSEEKQQWLFLIHILFEHGELDLFQYRVVFFLYFFLVQKKRRGIKPKNKKKKKAKKKIFLQNTNKKFVGGVEN